ncbi:MULTISPECIES: MerC domain-containing protein [unclassified Arsukibacterium]|uniref:MerC domain-containing protein n=1 Tax=unclassified Arsukibacterium TaxID=2635278 RepID=UPI000C66AA39|nr:MULTISPECIES: MerC domain-containing protein [unclassified Arsukibacterium]MAA93952.1 MerC protein [Rheinheimera sp.]MAD74291.1 MerC protein [Rheinheimera sp.]MBM33645.1 MerC protein [Rheinheimera sp.]HAW94491.1 MerC protein [Candidatus Azambacteria bacterium]
MLAKTRVLFDKVGITVTSLCAIHCILLPVLLPLLPLLGLTVSHNHAFERLMLLFTMVLGFVALFIGFHRYHRKLYPFYSLFLGVFIYWQRDVWGHQYEHVVLVIGASLVVLAHVMNMRLCSQCESCDTEHHADEPA